MGTCRSDGIDVQAATVMRQRMLSLPFSVQAPLYPSCGRYQYPGADGAHIVVNGDEFRQIRTERCVLSSQFEDLSAIDVTGEPDIDGGSICVRKKVRAKKIKHRPLQNLKGKVCSNLGSAIVINKCNAASYKPIDLPESLTLARSSQFTSSGSKVVTMRRAAGTGVFYMTPGISEFMSSESPRSGDNVERLSQLAAVACEEQRRTHQCIQDLSNPVTWNSSCKTIHDCCSFTTQAVKKRRTPRKSCRVQPIPWNYLMSRPHDNKSSVEGDRSASDSCSRHEILLGCSVRPNENHVEESTNLDACSMSLNSRMDESLDQSRIGKMTMDPNSDSKLSRDLTWSARNSTDYGGADSGGADTSILSKFRTLKCAGTKETLGDRCAKRVLLFVEEKGRVPEKLIREALGNNPDISKALRRLLKERRVKRLGNGRKDSAYVYMATPAGLCELQVLKTAAAGNNFSLPQPTPAVSQVGSCSATKCFTGAALYTISSCASG